MSDSSCQTVINSEGKTYPATREGLQQALDDLPRVVDFYIPLHGEITFEELSKKIENNSSHTTKTDVVMESQLGVKVLDEEDNR